MSERQLTQDLSRLFCIRDDTYTEQRKDGTHIRQEDPVTTQLLSGHLKGEVTIGLYQIQPETNLVKWLCWDIDPQHHEEPESVTRKIIICLEDFPSEAVLLEASRYPDPSYHVWLLFDPPINAKYAKAIGEIVKKKTGESNLEVFPKQTEVGEGEFGNVVKLPLGLHQEKGKWSKILDKETFAILPSDLSQVIGCSLSKKDELRLIETHPEIRTVKPKYEPRIESLRPCFQDMIKLENPGALGPKGHLKNKARMALVTEALDKGFGADTIAPLFSAQLDYKDGKKSRYHVRKLVEKAINDGIHSWFCDTIIREGWCTATDKEACFLTHTGRLRETKRPDDYDAPMDIKLTDICADLIGTRVRTNVQVRGESEPKAIPSRIEVYCKKCHQGGLINFDTLDTDDRTRYLAIAIFSKKKMEGLDYFLELETESEDSKKCRHNFTYDIIDWLDYSQLFISDILDPKVKFDAKIYKTQKGHLVIEKIPFAKKVTIEGWVSLDPTNKNLTIIADRIIPYADETTNFRATEEDKESWNTYFVGKTASDMNGQIAPSMVGRPKVQESLLLLTHSVAVIPDIHGRMIRGGLRIIFIGDTKTCKSLSGKDLTIDHYALGDYIVGESSSRTGITYTIDNDNHVLIWGALPMNDLGLLVIDGMHTIQKEEWRELREALENQRVVVARSLSGEALARTRTLGLLNPGRKDQKPMKHYTYPCMAIKDTWIFSDPADITRWDFFIPFGSDDVDKEKIANAKPVARPIPDDVFLRHSFWIWSRRPEQIEYTNEARERIPVETIKFINKYVVDDIPVVHLGYRDVITRISVAHAALAHSTDLKHEKIIVKEKHVEAAVAFLKGLIKDIQIIDYKIATEGKLTFKEEEVVAIIADLDETSIQIIHLIKVGGKSSTELMAALDLSEPTIKRKYAVLRKHGLINTRRGVGIELSPRGIIFLKEILSIIVSENDTNGPEIVSENDTLILSIRGEKIKFIKLAPSFAENPEATKMKSTAYSILMDQGGSKSLRDFFNDMDRLHYRNKDVNNIVLGDTRFEVKDNEIHFVGGKCAGTVLKKDLEKDWNKARKYGLIWLSDPRNIPFDEGWANLEKFQSFLSSFFEDNLDKGAELAKRMTDEGLVESHDTKRGLIRRVKEVKQ